MSSISLIATFSVLILHILLPWAQNIRMAKATGLPYVIVPFHYYNQFTAMVFNRTLLRLVNSLLSKPSPSSWRQFLTSTWPWKLRHAPFAELGTDTFLTVAPGGSVLNTADADVVNQIFSRSTDFPKATQMYRVLVVFGENVVASEGTTWRHHRKLTSPVFSEKNNQLVWKETLDLCQTTLDLWLNNTNKTIRTVGQDCMRLSLAVIGRAGLGQKMELSSTLAANRNSAGEELTKGHTMNFTDALTTVLHCIFYIIIVPKWLLKRIPSHMARKSYQGYHEFGLYMKEVIAAKRSSIKAAKGHILTNDLLSQLVMEQERDSSHQTSDGLTESEIMGNLFVMALAGHETSANSIHFSLLLLALYPQVQAEVQTELDEIFSGRRDASQWDYDCHLPRLLNSRLAMVLNEQLRLFAPTIAVPKITTTPQRLLVNGKEITIPENTVVRLCIPPLHRNPKFWPQTSPNKGRIAESTVDDLEEFKPERWLQRDDSSTVSSPTSNEASTMFVPKKGAYIPFSDGTRACLGRRFAQVEILTALSLILSQCSIELAVDEWVSDEEVDKMTNPERRQVWGKAEERAKSILRNDIALYITLQLRKGVCVPVRLVKRGEERFMNIS